MHEGQKSNSFQKILLSISMGLLFGLFAGLGTGLVCLVYGLLWDFAPFNKYQGMFWLTFMPLRANSERNSAR